MRVLYVHGLESGPGGRKARHLAEAGFVVSAERMPCGRADVRRDPAVLAAVVAAAALVSAAALAGGLPGLAAGAVGLAVAAPLARAALMRRVLGRSVAVQVEALARHRPDAVVASSFGGAVAVELIRRGAWTGPTVLLCPAHRLVAERAGLPVPALPPGARALVVHGRADDIVPLAHSEALVAGTSARLVVVDDDHRLSRAATPDALRAWVEGIARRPVERAGDDGDDQVAR